MSVDDLDENKLYLVLVHALVSLVFTQKFN